MRVNSDYRGGLLLSLVERGEFDGDIHEVGVGSKHKVLVLHSYHGNSCLCVIDAMSIQTVDVSSSLLLAFARSFTVTGKIELVPEGMFVRSIEDSPVIYVHLIEPASVLMSISRNGSMQVFNYDDQDLEWKFCGKHALLSGGISSRDEEHREINNAMFVPKASALLWIEGSKVLRACRINACDSKESLLPLVDCGVTLLYFPSRLHDTKLALELGQDEGSCWICAIDERLWHYSGLSGELLEVENDKAKPIENGSGEHESESFLTSLEDSLDYFSEKEDIVSQKDAIVGESGIENADSGIENIGNSGQQEQENGQAQEENSDERWQWLSKLHLATLLPDPQDLHSSSSSPSSSLHAGLNSLERMDLASLIKARATHTSRDTTSGDRISMNLEAFLVKSLSTPTSLAPLPPTLTPWEVVSTVQTVLELIVKDAETVRGVWESVSYAGLLTLSIIPASVAVTTTYHHQQVRVVIAKALLMSGRPEQLVPCFAAWGEGHASTLLLSRLTRSVAFLERVVGSPTGMCIYDGDDGDDGDDGVDDESIDIPFSSSAVREGQGSSSPPEDSSYNALGLLERARGLVELAASQTAS